MFKRFDRYIFKEIAGPFSIGLLVYTSTLLIDTIIKLSKLLITKSVSPGTFFQILGLTLPDLLSFTIPMANLMGILAGMSRMSSDSEIIALRTMGIGNRRIVKPVLWFSTCSFLLSFFLSSFIAPQANYRLSLLLREMALSYNFENAKPGIFFQEIPFFTIYFQEKDQEGLWKNVLLYSYQNPQKDTLILAEKGGLIATPDKKVHKIALLDGVVMSYNLQDPENQHVSYFLQQTEPIATLQAGGMNRRPTQMTLLQLRRRMAEEPGNLLVRLEFHNKFALPFASLALGLLGLSLGISTRKGGKISGLIVSLGIIFIYYILITVSRNIILQKLVPAFWGLWAPNIFLFFIGLFFYHFSAREKEVNWERLFFFVPRVSRRKDGGNPVWQKRKRINQGYFPLKILDWYILKRMFFFFGVVFSTLMLVFYLNNIIELMDDVIENRIPFFYNLQYNFFFTPYMVTLVLPISILTAVLLTFSLMSKNNEVVAVQVSGISLYRLVMPALMIGFLASAAVFLLQETLLPDWTQKAQEIRSYILKQELVWEYETKKNWVSGKDGEVYFYSTFEEKKNRFLQFNIIFLDSHFQLKKRITARIAYWIGEKKLKLEDGIIREYRNQTQIGFRKFPGKKLSISEDRDAFFQEVKLSPQMSIRELKQYIQYLKKINSETEPYQAQLYSNFAYPLSSLVMVWIAIPFSFLMGNRGALYGISLAVGISITFWGVLGIFSALGKTGVLPPLFSAFAPMGIFILISLVIFSRIRT